jgi:hypothetical protein
MVIIKFKFVSSRQLSETLKTTKNICTLWMIFWRVFSPDGGGSTFLWTYSTQPEYYMTVQQPRTSLIFTSPWKRQILYGNSAATSGHLSCSVGHLLDIVSNLRNSCTPIEQQRMCTCSRKSLYLSWIESQELASGPYPEPDEWKLHTPHFL